MDELLRELGLEEKEIKRLFEKMKKLKQAEKEIAEKQDKVKNEKWLK